MAANAIFDFMLRMTSDSIYNSLVVMPDSENMGIAVEILLLSGKQFVILFALPVHGSHLCSVTYANVGHFPNLLVCVAGSQNCKHRPYNCVAVLRTTRNISDV